MLTLHWSRDNLSIAAELSRLRTPVLVKGSQVRDWKALQLWTPQYLAKKVSFLKNARNGTEPRFIGVSTKEGLMDVSLLHPAKEAGRNFRLQDIRMKDFLLYDQAKPKSEYHYYSGPMAWWPGELHSHVMPIDFLQVDKELAVASVWMGHEGVTAQCHFDRSYNFFAQIHGRKRWTLYPPETWSLFYLYPHLHPNYHQSQVDSANPDLERFPHFARPNGQQVILEPGDVLYIPPYWFHQVESLDTGISLSVISPSEEELVWNQIQYYPLPFLPNNGDDGDHDDGDDGDHPDNHAIHAGDDDAADWPMFPHRVAAARLYLQHLIGQVIEDRQTAADFVAEAVIERRYAPLAARLEPFADPAVVHTIARHDCFRGELDLTDADGRGAGWEARVADWRRREVEVKKEVRRAAYKQSRLLRDLVSSVSDGVGAIVLANHIEQVANATVGGWHNALAFLRLCFPPSSPVI